jgi:branched-chain amino acid transport system permease protein
MIKATPFPGTVPLRASRTGIIGVALIFLLLPLVAGDFLCVFIAEIFIWGLFAMSFAMVYGYGGMLSFAQAVFFGAGCYGFNLGTFHFHFNTWGAILAAVAAAMAFALPVGYIATRVKQHHFLLVTVIISVLITTTLSSGHWRWLAGPFVTRSLTFVPELPLAVATLSFLDSTVTYYFTMVMVAIAFGLAWMLVHSPFGSALVAIRDNERRSQLIGLNVNTLRWMMFVAAAGVAGFSGALYALLARFTSLSFWHWTYSGKAVVMAIIGGAGSLVGPFLGTAFYMVVTEHLSRYFEQFIVIFGVLMLIIIRYAPEGLWGLILRGYRAAVSVKAS